MRALGRLRGWPPAPNQHTEHSPLQDFRPGDLEAEATRGERQSRRPRSEILARAPKKSFNTDLVLFRRTAFPDVRPIVQDCNTAAFGGGVKMQFSKSKKGEWGGRFPRGRKSSSEVLPLQLDSPRLTGGARA